MTENTFVIRIWCEHSEQESVKPQFRGVIEHVVTGQRQYLATIEAISQFIQPHLPNKTQNQTNSITNWIDQENR